MIAAVYPLLRSGLSGVRGQMGRGALAPSFALAQGSLERVQVLLEAPDQPRAHGGVQRAGRPVLKGRQSPFVMASGPLEVLRRPRAEGARSRGILGRFSVRATGMEDKRRTGRARSHNR